MIKEAIQYLVKLGYGERVVIDDRDYSTNSLYPITEPILKSFTIHTLSGIVDYFNSPDRLTKANAILHIETPSTLALFSSYDGAWKLRDRFLDIELMLGRPFNFGGWYDHEKFIIELQSKFLQTHTTEAILRQIGNISDEHVKNIADDGIGQQITVKKSITRDINS